MSKIEVDAIEPQSGTTLTIGASGDSVNIASGATITDFTSTGIDDNATSTAITIDSSQNVGIGTVSPGRQLEVSSTDPYLSLKSTSDTGTSQIFFGDPSDDNVGRINYDHSNNAMLILTSATEAMRINSSGNVGINTSSPQRYLHITGNDGASGTTSANSDTQLFIDNDGGNGGIIEFGASNTGAGRIMFSDEDAANIGKIEYVHSGDYMSFTTGASERMRFTSTGLVAINTTSPDAGSIVSVNHEGSTFYGLSLNSTTTSGTQYHLRFARGGISAGYITSNSATTIAVNNSSDERLKENIENSGSAIQDIKDIQVRQFDWIDNIDTHRDFGFVAQELVNVVPEAVTQGTDELDDNGKPVRSWGVDYSHIVPRLVKVCQEQQTKIEELEARILALETNQP